MSDTKDIFTWQGSKPTVNTEGVFTKKFHIVRRDADGIKECTHRVVRNEAEAAGLLMHIPPGTVHTDYVMMKELVVDVCRRVGKNTPHYVPELMQFVPATPEREAHYSFLSPEEMARMAGSVSASATKRARV